MICPCGGICRTHEVKAGTAYKCPACGRYEVFKPKRPAEPAQKDLLGDPLRNRVQQGVT